jgi:RHS repeat-associated protein
VYTPYGFAGGYTDSTSLIYLINRYYDPTTGLFMSVDPLVSETGEAYTYTGNDPVNVTDASGLTSEGYCFDGSGAAFFATGTVQICAVEVNNNSQVGITVTGGGGVTFNTAQILNSIDSPSSLAKLFGASGTLNYQRSSANQICSLGGIFDNTTISGSVLFTSLTFTHFTSSSGVQGSQIGGGVGWNGIKSVASAGISGYVTNTHVFVLHGNAAAYISTLITVLNWSNTFHTTGLPDD